MEKNELDVILVNNLEAVNRKLDQLLEAIRKNNDLSNASTSATKDLKETIVTSNVLFEQVSQGVKDLYAKVQQIEMVAKLAKNLGPMLGGLGGLGGFGAPPPKK